MGKLLIAIIAAICAGNALAADRVQLIPPERLAHYWLLESGSATQASVPNSGHNLDAPSCAAVAYTVGNDGRTRDVKLEKLVPAGDLGKVAVSVVAAMRFAAAPQNLGKTPVRTYVAMPFNLPSANSANSADLARRTQGLAPCQLEGYGERGATQVVPIR
jgi:hypothetical protein